VKREAQTPCLINNIRNKVTPVNLPPKNLLLSKETLLVLSEINRKSEDLKTDPIDSLENICEYKP